MHHTTYTKTQHLIIICCLNLNILESINVRSKTELNILIYILGSSYKEISLRSAARFPFTIKTCYCRGNSLPDLLTEDSDSSVVIDFVILFVWAKASDTEKKVSHWTHSLMSLLILQMPYLYYRQFQNRSTLHQLKEQTSLYENWKIVKLTTVAGLDS